METITTVAIFTRLVMVMITTIMMRTMIVVMMIRKMIRKIVDDITNNNAGGVQREAAYLTVQTRSSSTSRTASW